MHGHRQPNGLLGGTIDHFLNEAVENIIINSTVYQTTAHIEKKTIKADVNHCEIINSNCGYWLNDRFEIFTNNLYANTPSKALPNVARNSKLSTFWVFGDSVGKGFFQSLTKKGLCKRIFNNCKLTYTHTYKFKDPVAKEFHTRNGKNYSESRFLDGIRQDLNHIDMHRNTSVFMINFGIHHLKVMTFNQAKSAFQGLLRLVQDVRSRLKGDAPLIIWKTTTPPFYENLKLPVYTGFRFLTKQVSACVEILHSLMSAVVDLASMHHLRKRAKK